MFPKNCSLLVRTTCIYDIYPRQHPHTSNPTSPRASDRPPSHAMGVHESNKGLCEALHRAFETMNCAHQTHRSTTSPTDSPSPSSDAMATCKDVIDRLIVRECSLPDSLRHPESHISTHVV